MDWDARRDEIQARYFRTGAYAFMTIARDPSCTDIVEWRFTFADLGMYHVLESRARVSRSSGGFVVDGLAASTEDEALDRVFSGHYARFLNGFYADANFKPLSRL